MIGYHEHAEPLVVQTVGRMRKRGSGVHALAGDSRAAPPSEEPGHVTRPVSNAGFDLSEQQHSFLLIPVSEAGKHYGQQAHQVLPALHTVSVPGQADLMICREQGCLKLEDLEQVLKNCRNAYQETAHAPNVSSHARFDINDWTPLDP
jgi:hypothetical protein